jgi:tRNA uridine 5-carboxymethylaminomethyl modification enzyme
MKINKLKPTGALNKKLEVLGTSKLNNSVPLLDLLKRPQIGINELIKLARLKLNFPKDVLEEIEIEIKYEGFIKRQLEEVGRFNRIDKIKMPHDIDYRKIPSLSREISEKLEKYKPVTLGQASRISGVTPAAVSLLMVYLNKLRYNLMNQDE